MFSINLHVGWDDERSAILGGVTWDTPPDPERARDEMMKLIGRRLDQLVEWPPAPGLRISFVFGQEATR